MTIAAIAALGGAPLENAPTIDGNDRPNMHTPKTIMRSMYSAIPRNRQAIWAVLRRLFAFFGELFGIRGDNQVLVTGRNTQNIGRSGLAKRHTGGHNKLICRLCNAFLYGCSRRIQDSGLKTVHFWRFHAVQSPGQTQPSGRPNQRSHRDNRHWGRSRETKRAVVPDCE